MGRSPQDIEYQITYPLTITRMGILGVKIIRSSPMFGFSSINLIIEEDVEFYWSRIRILEEAGQKSRTPGCKTGILYCPGKSTPGRHTA